MKLFIKPSSEKDVIQIKIKRIGSIILVYRLKMREATLMPEEDVADNDVIKRLGTQYDLSVTKTDGSLQTVTDLPDISRDLKVAEHIFKTVARAYITPETIADIVSDLICMAE